MKKNKKIDKADLKNEFDNSVEGEDQTSQLEEENNDDATILKNKLKSLSLIHSKYNELEDKYNELEDQIKMQRAEEGIMISRYEKKIEDIKRFSNEDISKDIAELNENIISAINAVDKNKYTNDTLYEGLILIAKILNKVLAKNGIERIYPKGEPFNPDMHHAIQTSKVKNAKPNTISEVIKAGYLINKRLLIAALVAVVE